MFSCVPRNPRFIFPAHLLNVASASNDACLLGVAVILATVVCAMSFADRFARRHRLR